jgi:hypothetical protein
VNFTGKDIEDKDLIRLLEYGGGNYNWALEGNVANGTSFGSNLNVFPLPSHR